MADDSSMHPSFIIQFRVSGFYLTHPPIQGQSFRSSSATNPLIPLALMAVEGTQCTTSLTKKPLVVADTDMI